MCFGKKKNSAELTADDRQILKESSDKVGKLVMLTSDETAIAKLKDLQEKIKYLMPAKTKETLGIDKRIADKVDDLKAELVKHGDKPTKIDDVISDILLLLVNRN